MLLVLFLLWWLGCRWFGFDSWCWSRCRGKCDRFDLSCLGSCCQWDLLIEIYFPWYQFDLRRCWQFGQKLFLLRRTKFTILRESWNDRTYGHLRIDLRASHTVVADGEDGKRSWYDDAWVSRNRPKQTHNKPRPNFFHNE